MSSAGARSIRLATFEDVDDVAVLFDAYRQFYGRPSDPDLARTFLSDRMRDRESLVLLAEKRPRELVGFCQIYPSFCSIEAAPMFVLYDLFVVTAQRGTGVGRALMQAAQALAKARGAVKMELSTAKSNRAAQALYVALGWERNEVFDTFSLKL